MTAVKCNEPFRKSRTVTLSRKPVNLKDLCLLILIYLCHLFHLLRMFEGRREPFDTFVRQYLGDSYVKGWCWGWGMGACRQTTFQFKDFWKNKACTMTKLGHRYTMHQTGSKKHLWVISKWQVEIEPLHRLAWILKQSNNDCMQYFAA